MISIITITFNNIDGLKKTAENIQGQTLKTYDWVIVDGASADGSKEYLDSLSANIISEPDRGIYDAMNKGISRAKGEYLIFMNAGDCFADETVLEKLSNVIRSQTQPDFIYGPALEERPGMPPAFKPAHEVSRLFWGMITHHQAMIYKTSLCQNLSYNTEYKISADYDFTCRFLKQAETIYKTDFPICLFEAGGISQVAVKRGREEQYDIRKKQKLAPLGSNYLILKLQSLVMLFRQTCPSLYWALRSRQKS